MRVQEQIDRIHIFRELRRPYFVATMPWFGVIERATNGKQRKEKNLLQTSWVTYILLFSLRFLVSDLIHYYLLSHHSIIFPPASRFRTHISMLYADTVLIFAPRYIRNQQ